VMGGMDGVLAGDIGGVTRKASIRYRRIDRLSSFRAKIEQ
jgi:hypothetical protein